MRERARKLLRDARRSQPSNVRAFWSWLLEVEEFLQDVAGTTIPQADGDQG
jgi:hypothetical protein